MKVLSRVAGVDWNCFHLLSHFRHFHRLQLFMKAAALWCFSCLLKFYSRHLWVLSFLQTSTWSYCGTFLYSNYICQRSLVPDGLNTRLVIGTRHRTEIGRSTYSNAECYNGPLSCLHTVACGTAIQGPEENDFVLLGCQQRVGLLSFYIHGILWHSAWRKASIGISS